MDRGRRGPLSDHMGLDGALSAILTGWWFGLEEGCLLDVDVKNGPMDDFVGFGLSRFMALTNKNRFPSF